MNSHFLFRKLVLLSFAIYVVYFFLSDFHQHIYSSDEMELLAWNGLGATLGSVVAFPYVLGVAYTIITMGLFFYKAWARTGFMLIVIINGFSAVFAGISVSGGWDSMLGYFLAIIDGFLLAMVYLTPLVAEFEDA